MLARAEARSAGVTPRLGRPNEMSSSSPSPRRPATASVDAPVVPVVLAKEEEEEVVGVAEWIVP